jgi:hypothetical protein
MTSSFRYVHQQSDASVNLFLFSTGTGSARATVTGPVSYDHSNQSKIFETMASLPLARAFSSAIRMANRNDVEIVVSGDRNLWDTDWGFLGAPT